MQNPQKDKKIIVINNRYKLTRRIGAGSFGQIYIGVDVKTNHELAFKLEDANNTSPQLGYESKLYRVLEGSCNVPRLYFYSTTERYNVMAVDLLGKSLEDQLTACHHHLSLKSVLMLVDQMISCVEFVHQKNYIHRDIKPDNFVMGVGKNANKVYIIDFGLSKRYRDQNTHQHIKWVEGKSLTGTARYASVNALKGCEQSRRDDMEALGYVWIYLLKGVLPWMGLKGRDQVHKYDRICEVKQKTSFEDLCKGFPYEFVTYFKEVRKLNFEDVPLYSKYKEMFRNLFVKLGYVYDGNFDWSERRIDMSKSMMLTRDSYMSNNLRDNVKRNATPQNHMINNVLPSRNQYASNFDPFGNRQSSVGLQPKQQLKCTVPIYNDVSKRRENNDAGRRYESPVMKRTDPLRTVKDEYGQYINDIRSFAQHDYSLQRIDFVRERGQYSPPRLLRSSQLPRWMADLGRTVTRL